MQKVPTTRDRCVVHMCASSVLSRRRDVPGTCPTQKLALFINLIQMGPRINKPRISEIPRPGRYRTNIKLKKQTKKT